MQRYFFEFLENFLSFSLSRLLVAKSWCTIDLSMKETDFNEPDHLDLLDYNLDIVYDDDVAYEPIEDDDKSVSEDSFVFSTSQRLKKSFKSGVEDKIYFELVKNRQKSLSIVKNRRLQQQL